MGLFIQVHAIYWYAADSLLVLPAPNEDLYGLQVSQEADAGEKLQNPVRPTGSQIQGGLYRKGREDRKG